MRVPPDNDPPKQPADSRDPAAAEKTKETDATAAAGPPPPPAKERIVKLLGGKLTVDVYQHPFIGSPEAPHVAVEMISYDCPHCRKMYKTMEHVLQRYGDQVVLVVMIMPMESECNRLIVDSAANHRGACITAKLALGVAKLNPPGFASIHDFLMSGDKESPPAMGSIYSKAYVLAERGRLRDYSRSADVEKQIGGYVDLFDRLTKESRKKDFGLPVQILGDYIMSGSVEKEEDVFKAWEQHLGVKPK